MHPLGWAIAGFAAGVAATSAVVLATSPWSPASQGARTQKLLSADPSGGEALTADPLGELDIYARMAMPRWMTANPKYEFITRDFCGCRDIPKPNCPEFEEERIRLQSDYPYTDAGDYNGDGNLDFAIMIALKGKPGPNLFLIFNGPFGDGAPTPVFSCEGWRVNDYVGDGYVGTNESDDGYTFKPKGPSYALVYTGNPQ